MRPIAEIFNVASAFALVVLLLTQSHGPWLIFKAQQITVAHEIKQQIKAGVPESELVRLSIAKVWEENANQRFERIHSREFRFDGEMYDIVRTEPGSDSTVYYCIHDVKETGLFAKLDEMTSHSINEGEQKGKRAQFTDWICQKYFAETMYFNSGFNLQPIVWRPSSPDIIRHYCEVSFPPPEYTL